MGREGNDAFGRAVMLYRGGELLLSRHNGGSFFILIASFAQAQNTKVHLFTLFSMLVLRQFGAHETSMFKLKLSLIDRHFSEACSFQVFIF